MPCGRAPALFVMFDAVLLLGAWLTLLRLGERPGWPAFAVALAMLLTPQFLLHQGTVWKDMLFADSAIAAFAVLAACGTFVAIRWPWLGLCGLLLALAALARQNGFVLLPVAALALGWIAARRSGWRAGLAYGAGFLLAALLLTGGRRAVALNQRGDGGEGARAEIHRAQIYDLVGARERRRRAWPLPLLDRQQPQLSRLMRSDGVRLYSPVLNDTLEDLRRARCRPCRRRRTP